MDIPFVTIITVTYNSSKYVRDAIESVLNSKYSNFELIIADDCSSDSTWSIINEYNDDRITKYRNEVNLGEYPNRNKAISLAKGEYLLFIDGDDMIYPHALGFFHEMSQFSNGCGMILMRWFKNNIFYPIRVSPLEFYIEDFFYEGFLNTAYSNVLFNTSILQKMGGLDNRFATRDNFVRLIIAAEYDTLIISDQLTWWRETPNQASQLIKISRALVEDFKIRTILLDSKQNPLDSNLTLLAKKKLNAYLIRVCISFFLKFKFNELFYIIKNCDRLFKFWFQNIFCKIKYPESTLSKYSPSSPKKISN